MSFIVSIYQTHPILLFTFLYLLLYIIFCIIIKVLIYNKIKQRYMVLVSLIFVFLVSTLFRLMLYYPYVWDHINEIKEILPVLPLFFIKFFDLMPMGPQVPNTLFADSHIDIDSHAQGNPIGRRGINTSSAVSESENTWGYKDQEPKPLISNTVPLNKIRDIPISRLHPELQHSFHMDTSYNGKIKIRSVSIVDIEIQIAQNAFSSFDVINLHLTPEQIKKLPYMGSEGSGEILNVYLFLNLLQWFPQHKDNRHWLHYCSKKVYSGYQDTEGDAAYIDEHTLELLRQYLKHFT